ncbi:MAG: hypothetical protein WCJ25_00495 [Candidatus Moraniibacteriota bacterium]
MENKKILFGDLVVKEGELFFINSDMIYVSFGSGTVVNDISGVRYGSDGEVGVAVFEFLKSRWKTDFGIV